MKKIPVDNGAIKEGEMNETILPKETVMLDKFASDLGLEMLYAGRGIITLTTISVDRPGLRLAGFFKIGRASCRERV